MDELTWEEVKDDRAGWMERAAVPGGWIYRHTQDIPIIRHGTLLEHGFAWQSSMVFVPSPTASLGEQG